MIGLIFGLKLSPKLIGAAFQTRGATPERQFFLGHLMDINCEAIARINPAAQWQEVNVRKNDFSSDCPF